MTDIRREIRRTAGDLETTLSTDGRYVRISDGQCGWWQPVDKLLPILTGLPDWDDALAAQRRPPRFDAWTGEVEEQEEGEAVAMAYAGWCNATGAAGFFGHNAGGDSMTTPPDFRE